MLQEERLRLTSMLEKLEGGLTTLRGGGAVTSSAAAAAHVAHLLADPLAVASVADGEALLELLLLGRGGGGVSVLRPLAAPLGDSTAAADAVAVAEQLQVGVLSECLPAAWLQVGVLFVRLPACLAVWLAD